MSDTLGHPQSPESPALADAPGGAACKDKERKGRSKSGDVVDGRTCSSTYNDATADVELISSGNVVFKVHSYQLMAGSVVFRDILNGRAVKQDAPRKIELTDTTIENTAAIKDFLDCLHGKELFDIIKTADRAKRLIAILQKYDCPTWLNILRQTTRLASARMTESHNPFTLFVISAAMQDPLGCSEAIPAAGKKLWKPYHKGIPDERQANMQRNVKNRSVLDVAGMSARTMTMIPISYLGALARGFTKRGDTHGDPRGGDWEAVADEFYRVLNIDSQETDE